MLDPLSLSSGIAGLLSLTIEVTRTSYEYISGVKDAPKSALALISAVTSLENVLRDLRNKIVLNADVADLLHSVQLSSSVRDQVLQQCEVDLRAFLDELRNQPGVGTPTSSWQRLKWPIKEPEMRKKLERLQWYQSQLTTLTTNDTLVVTSLTYKEVKDWRNEGAAEKALDWLSPLDFDAKQQDMLSRWQPGTCQWVLDSAAFKQWSEESIDVPEKKILWCSGAPCVGKTVASSVVIAHLAQEARSLDHGVAYVYCNYGDQINQTPPTLLGSLAKQLAEQSPSFPSTLASLFATRQKKPPTIEVCLDILNQVSEMFSKTFLVIDAFDEMENASRKMLLGLIAKVARFRTNVRLFVTSRPHLSDISNAFNEAIKLSISARREDVQAYLRTQIQSNTDLEDILDDDEKLKEHIVQTILMKSGNQFLLPSLHIERLNDVTCKDDVADVLNDLTVTVEETYRQTFDRIRDKSRPRQELAESVMLWLSYARRPLKFEELQEAVALKWKDTVLEIKSVSPRKIILEACMGLVTTESQGGTITLVHSTLEGYFKSQYRSKVDPDAFIARLLLSYLSRTIISQAPRARYNDFAQPLLERCPLLPYGYHFWHDHAKSSQDLFETAILSYFSTRPKILPIPNDPLHRSMSTALLKRSVPVPPIWEELFYAVVLHLNHIVRRLVQRGANPFAYYADLGCPSILTWVCFQYMDYLHSYEVAENVFSRIVKEIFQDHIELGKAHYRDLIHLTIIFPLLSEEVMSLVLARGFDVTRMYSFPRPVEYWVLTQGRGTSLHMAAFYESPTAVKLLIQHGANPNEAANGVTPLEIAVVCCYPSSEDRLLDTIAALLSGGAQPILKLPAAIKVIKERNLETLLNIHAAADTANPDPSAPELSLSPAPPDYRPTSVEDAFTRAVFESTDSQRSNSTESASPGEENSNPLQERRAKSHVRRLQYESTSSKMRQDSFRKSSTDALTNSIMFDQVMEID